MKVLIWMLAGLGLAGLIGVVEVGSLVWPPFSDATLQASFVDTWQPQAMYYLGAFWVVVASMIVALVLARLGRGKSRRVSAVTVGLAIGAILLLHYNDAQLAQRASHVTGLQVIPALHSLPLPD